MKYITLIFTMLLVCSASAWGQTQADIDRIFTSLSRQDGKSKEIIISGDALKGTDMKTYHSIVITDSPTEADAIAAEVNRCAANATGREVERIGGKIYFAKYTLPATSDSKYNRYLLFLNTHLKGGDNIKVIYLTKKGELDNIK